MKALLLLVSGLMVLAVAGAPGKAGAVTFNVADTHPATTCGGDDPRPSAQTYMFGFKGPRGFCTTQLIYANTYGEARECARAVCLICQVEDITGKFINEFSFAKPPYKAQEGYCPRR